MIAGHLLRKSRGLFRMAASAWRLRRQGSPTGASRHFGVVMDPFGHRWAIMTRVEDVPAEEAERRVQEWLASQAG